MSRLARFFPLLSNLIRGRAIDSGSVILNRRRIYILPTRRGIVFAVFLVAMLLGSINYALSLGFILTFLLAGLGVVGMLHTYRNLAGVKITPGGCKPVFAGEPASFYLCLEAPGVRPAIGLRWKKNSPQWLDLLEPGAQCEAVLVPSTQRGWLTPDRLTVFSTFPLGFFRAWSYVDFGARCVIYPKPIATPLLLPAANEDQSGAQNSAAEGAEDFSGLREYRLGDPPRHVAWKASSHNDAMLTKQFAATGSAVLWLDWRRLNAVDDETRIAQLTSMVLEAERTHRAYGLRLPGEEYPPGLGEAQRDICLTALALFGLSEPAVATRPTARGKR